ncbi:unnamed protein product [Plutella xylostella]|uniref:(diamondback moth) hypothetical protein n=1 Tax=Plutella xylostella TaxID=51655 RepID=A0A8S4FBF5_PLUXY|nr:unnamed protein product [Plutella xylostella]
MFESLLQFFQSELQELYKWSKCGDGALSAVPTLLWALGAAALSQRILDGLFRRFLFRRVPLWEVVLQQLLFVWMVIYSLHFWVFSVRIIKVLIDYFLDDGSATGGTRAACGPWTNSVRPASLRSVRKKYQSKRPYYTKPYS